jgi:hypothetical protein
MVLKLIKLRVFRWNLKSLQAMSGKNGHKIPSYAILSRTTTLWDASVAYIRGYPHVL